MEEFAEGVLIRRHSFNLIKVFFIFLLFIGSDPFRNALLALTPGPSDATLIYAVQLFETGKFREAEQAFAKILSQTPDHKLGRSYYARSLFRNGKIVPSFKVFSKLGFAGLDTPSRYDFGLVYFQTKSYRGALAALKGIPSGHSLYDLANFYGGISAAKIGKFAEAEIMLEKAVVLPSKLLKTKSNYLAEARRQKRPKDPKRPSPSKVTDKVETVAAPPPSVEEKIRGKQRPHGGFKYVKDSFELQIDYKQQILDFHGFAEKKSDTRITAGAFNLGHFFLWPKGTDAKRKVGLGFQMVGRGEEVYQKGEPEKRNIQTNSSDDFVRIQTGDPTRQITKNGTIELGGFLEVPMGPSFWIGGGGKVFLKFPDFETKSRSLSQNGYVFFGYKPHTIEILGEFDYLEVTGADNTPLTSQSSGMASLVYQMVEILNFDYRFKHSNTTYKDSSLDGPTSATSLSLDTYVDLPINISLGLLLAGLYQSQNLIHGRESFSLISADGETLTLNPYVQFYPVDWFEVYISQQFQQTKWSNVTPAESRDVVFERTETDYIEEFSAGAKLILWF